MADDVERARRELIRRVRDGIGSLPFVAFLSEYEQAVIAAAEARGREQEKARQFEESAAAGERLFNVRGELIAARNELQFYATTEKGQLKAERDAAQRLAGEALALLRRAMDDLLKNYEPYEGTGVDGETEDAVDALLARHDAQAALAKWREQQ